MRVFLDANIFFAAAKSPYGGSALILALAKKFGYKIKEIPITWVNDPFSNVSASSYIQFFWEVLKIKIWMMAGKYKL